MDGEGKVAPDMSSLLSVNQLEYRLPPSLSVVTSRAMKQFRSSRLTHEFGSMIELVLSTGSSFCDMRQSFLSFDVVVPDGVDRTKISLPSGGGWQQLFNAYTVVHSSGVELDRQKESVGEWEQLRNYYNKSEEWRKTVAGPLWGHRDIDATKRRKYVAPSTGLKFLTSSVGETAFTGGNVVFNVDVLKNITATVEPTVSLNDIVPPGLEKQYPTIITASTNRIRVAIPFANLLPMFDVDVLAPSYLLAGLRIELYTNPPQKLFTTDGSVPVVGWLIDNVRANMECFTLTDAIVRKIAQISASSGLEYPWTAVHQISQQPDASQFSVHVSRSLSRANNIVAKLRNAADLLDVSKDSFSSQVMLEKEFNRDYGTKPNNILQLNGTILGAQAILGSQFMPSKPIDNIPELLHSALKTFGNFRRWDQQVGVQKGAFSGELITDYSTVAADAPNSVFFTPNIGVVAIPLENSSSLAQSGQAVNAQRTAILNLALTESAVGVKRRVDLYVEYTKLCTLMLDSVIVRS